MRITGTSNARADIKRDPSRDPSRHFAPVAPPLEKKVDRFEPSESRVEATTGADVGSGDSSEERARDEEKRRAARESGLYGPKGKKPVIETGLNLNEVG